MPLQTDIYSFYRVLAIVQQTLHIGGYGKNSRSEVYITFFCIFIVSVYRPASNAGLVGIQFLRRLIIFIAHLIRLLT